MYLVGGIPTPLKNMSSSVGAMKFPIYGKILMFQTSNQIHTCIYIYIQYIYIYIYIISSQFHFVNRSHIPPGRLPADPGAQFFTNSANDPSTSRHLICFMVAHLNLLGGAITILKTDGVRQWEGWHPIHEMENKTCLNPPTRDNQGFFNPHKSP